MKTKFKLYSAIIFTVIGIMIADSSVIVFPIVFGLVGFGFGLWFHHDVKDMSEEELDNFLGIKDE